MTLVDAPVRTRPFAPNCHIGGRERELLLDALESCSWSGFRAGTDGRDARELCAIPSADARDLDLVYLGGRYVRMLEAMFAERMRTTFAIACNSATSGLMLALGALELAPGDEVLVPCMSFHATATTIVASGARPVFVEVDPDTLCIDPIDAASKITPRTRAIMVVHLGGMLASMDAIVDLARRHRLKIIEDCAQALGAKHRGRYAGAIGDAGVYSLTETKNITCGEGGVVVTNDARIAMRCRLLRNHGEAHVDDVLGMNYRLTELQAAVAVAQFEQLDERNRIRNENARHIIDGLRRFPRFTPQRLEEGCEPACYMLKFRYRGARDELVRRLHAEGIPVIPGYERLLHENPIHIRRFGATSLPRSEAINRELLWFPFINPPNTRDDMDDAVRAIEKVLG